jgi:biopolymer transport protein TolR
MAFSSGSNGFSARGRRGRYAGSTLAEMNIVPLVDVVLVLLIIFMITAQAMEFGLQIEVPKVKESTSTVKDLPVLSITRDGAMKLNETPLANIALIREAVRQRFGDSVNEIYVRADRNLVLGTYVQVLSALQQANLKVNVVARQEEIR